MTTGIWELGGGAVGGNLPPQLWTVNVIHFIFVLQENLGLSQKKYWAKSGVLSFG